MKKTLIRIVTGIFLVGLLVLCLHLGDIVFLLIFGGFFLITVREMDSLIKAMGKEIVITPASIFAGFFGIVYYLTSYNLSVVFAFGLLMVAATIMGQVLLMEDDFSAAAYCLLPFVYPILSECALVAIYFALPPWMAKTACCAAILCPSMVKPFFSRNSMKSFLTFFPLAPTKHILLGTVSSSHHINLSAPGMPSCSTGPYCAGFLTVGYPVELLDTEIFPL